MAQLSDLDDIVTIVIAAFRADPQWCYRFPYAAKYTCDHRRYTRSRYIEYFESVKSGMCTMMVAEMPDKHKPRTRKVVAFSLWQMPGKHGITSATTPNTLGEFYPLEIDAYHSFVPSQINFSRLLTACTAREPTRLLCQLQQSCH